MLIQIWMKFVSKGPIDNKSEWVQVIALYWTGSKPLLPEPMLAKFQDAIYSTANYLPYITSPQWVKWVFAILIP